MPMMKTAEAAAELNIAPNTLLKLAKAGRIRATILDCGGRNLYRFDPAYIESLKSAEPQPPSRPQRADDIDLDSLREHYGASSQ